MTASWRFHFPINNVLDALVSYKIIRAVAGIHLLNTAVEYPHRIRRCGLRVNLVCLADQADLGWEISMSSPVLPIVFNKRKPCCGFEHVECVLVISQVPLTGCQ